MPPRLARTAACASALAVAGLLAGCAPTVAMSPAPDANSPRCAAVTVRLPDEIGGKKARSTDAQATGAWGDPAVVLLRCGVAPIGPTTKPCVSVNDVDWVLVSNPASDVRQYVTFGRVPAVEVVIQRGSSGVPDATVLPALAQAVQSIPASDHCVGP